MQIGDLFQKIAIGSFALLDSPLHSSKLPFAHLRSVLRLVALLKKRFFVRFQLGNYPGLFTRNLLPFCFDRFYPFFDPRYPERDFFLLLLELFQCNNLVAQLGKICRLRGPLASEVDFTFLEETSVVPERNARALAPEL